MADATLEALIPKTQELLQPLIAKPKLADKLLAKPPFRFLHDIFSALQQATGFPAGLYNAFELDSANIKDKAQKLTYLDKMIVCVGLCAGKEVDVRAAKIVAGLEPENTNLLLQELARVAGNKALDWAKAIQQTLVKIPSLTGDAAGAAPSEPAAAAAAPTQAPAAAATAAPAAAATAAPSVRPSSKERAESQEKAAPSEAKMAKKAKDDPEKAAAPAEVEKRASPPSEAKEPSAAPPSRAAAPAPATSGAGAELQQQIRECNGDFEKTKDMVEKVIAKPKMSVKLLSKPPFRFLHDIVSEVTRVTGFADGLYTPEELDSNNIKEKQPKIDYLNKIISCVSCHLNVELEAKPAKIVAGLEPEQTNTFLQLLSIACRQGSSATAVQRVLTGDTSLRPAAAAPAASAKAAAPAPAPKADPVAAPAAEAKPRAVTPPETKAKAQPAPDAKEPTPRAEAPRALKPTDDDEDSGNLRFPSAQAKDAGEKESAGAEPPAMAAPGTSGMGTTSRTSRPTTARRRPPKLKENVTEVGRLMVPDAKTISVAGLMKDGDNPESDDEPTDEAGGPSGASSNASRTSTPEDGAVHGRMLQEILKEEAAARKQKEEEDAKEAAAAGPTLEAETGIRLGRRSKSFKGTTKGAASSAAEMMELRASIQQICQATLPMGKCIEFVHEDLDAMSKELERWRKEFETKCEAYEEERKKTDKELQPLQAKLREVEEEIKEQVHKINSLKATIVKNEDKTQQILRSVVSA